MNTEPKLEQRPARRYATLLHIGPYDGLMDATARLLNWAAAHDIEWHTENTKNGEQRGTRIELYLTDPAAEPDPQKWQTELAFLVAEAQPR